VRATLRCRPFALVWCAGLISQSGDWVLITALPYALYALTGSPVAGTALLADSIFTALLVPFVKTVAGGDAQALGTLFAVRGVARCSRPSDLASSS
jgi:uncharacterized RDD family membrane protein YckC